MQLDSDSEGFDVWKREKRNLWFYQKMCSSFCSIDTLHTWAKDRGFTHFYMPWTQTVVLFWNDAPLSPSPKAHTLFFCCCDCVAWLQYMPEFFQVHCQAARSTKFQWNIWSSNLSLKKRNFRSVKNWAQIGHQGRNLTKNLFFCSSFYI